MDSEAENNGKLFHLIDDDSTFKDGMSDFLSKNNLIELKKHYNIVSVIGSQSSGKSTLLNNLFGTDFKVMQQKVSRSQTTKGIFVAKDKDAPLLVLDVEGTDSKERWDDRQFFAKSTGIFALALSQVLVINIWTNMINNYEGQQLGIIKTIFEMNLKLFGHDQTKSIVFILRDYDPDENFDFIKESIDGDLQKLWSEIKKPEQYEGKLPQDLFNIDYVCLSSYKLQKNEFFSEVKALRSKFTNSEDENYYFKSFDYAGNLPADALSDYAGNIWDTIRNNKDINLPNEKEIISQIRCESIKKEAIEIANPLIAELGKKVNQGVCDTFNEIGLKAYKSAIKYYEDKADYVPKIVQEKKEDLEHQILSDLYTHFVTQMSKAKELIVTELDQFLAAGFEGGVVTQLKKLQNIQQGAMQQATSILINSLIVNNEIWEKEKFENEFKMIIEGALESKFGAILTRYFTDNIDNAVVSEFNNFGTNFWDNLQNNFNEQVENLENKFLPIMNFTNHKLQKEKLHFKDQIYRIYDHKLKEKLLNINDSMIKKFQKDFRFKENGSPENWRGLEETEIDEKYNKVKTNILSILNIFKFNEIKQDMVPTFNKFSSVIPDKKAPVEGISASLDDADKPRLLNEAELNKIKQEFDKQTAEEMENAIRAKNQTDILGIPKAVWALLIFFGYDDILRWLSNPLLMTPLFMIIGIVALAFSTGNQTLVFTAIKFIQGFAQQKFKQFIK